VQPPFHDIYYLIHYKKNLKTKSINIINTLTLKKREAEIMSKGQREKEERD